MAALTAPTNGRALVGFVATTIAAGLSAPARRPRTLPSKVPISQATFEGKVRGRLAGADKPAAMVVATKPTSALPFVGAVSAAILILIGYLLGGWVVAAATGVFALFIFGVALAGTRTTKDRLEHRRSKGLAPTMEPTEPVPTVVADANSRIEGLV